MIETNDKLIKQVIQLLNDEIIPAEGCTEPIAIAYAAAKATEVLGKKPEKMNIYISGNIIKNVKSVVVPNSGGMVGIAVSAAMGAFAGDASKELMVISAVKPEQLSEVKAFLDKQVIHIQNSKNNMKLYIKVKVFAGSESASVEMKHSHTNITEIVKNDEVIHKLDDSNHVSPEDAAAILSIKLIYDLAKTIDTSLIKDIFDKVIDCNLAIANEGLNNDYGVNIGRNIKKSMDSGFYGSDVRNKAASLAAAGSDARMGGSAMPVMTTAGSGNVGLTASLPVVTYARERGKTQEELYRALFFSHLATVHIKASIGRLSAYCGPMCAAGGVAGAIGLLNEFDYDTVAKSIINTLAGVSGVLCDGANSSCAVKIANGTYAAYDGIAMAANGKVVANGEGIVAGDVEQ
ncbi:MAG: L-serine ammonia-lyase, iron-sulfur-dependent, subunit alpha [Burkholderiales bacterium]|nr:L-serine ammonia-lyase, iron-sulfur-dependent, subunit alpha [Burkholderiales bacterium]